MRPSLDNSAEWNEPERSEDDLLRERVRSGTEEYSRNVPRWIIVRRGKGAWIQWEEDIPPGNGCPGPSFYFGSICQIIPFLYGDLVLYTGT